jgi:CRISPR system Cascade subunit CasD
MRYLIFRPYGPLASWGEAAVGETRPTADHPGRAAVIGMLAAALGIKRHEETHQRALRDGIRVAVQQRSAGVLLRDYHTAQVPPRQRKVTHYTRRDELSVPKNRLSTILSSRSYRCDGYWVAAVEALSGLPWSLDDLAAALRRPRFPLYLGRRAFAPAAPLAPHIVEAGGLHEAFATELPALTPLKPEDESRRLGIGPAATYTWEGDAGDLEAEQTRYPSDEPLHRGRWQFRTRPEQQCARKEDG